MLFEENILILALAIITPPHTSGVERVGHREQEQRKTRPTLLVTGLGSKTPNRELWKAIQDTAEPSVF